MAAPRKTYTPRKPAAPKPVVAAKPVEDFESLAGLTEEELQSTDNAPVSLGAASEDVATDKDALIAALQAQLAALTGEPKAETEQAEEVEVIEVQKDFKSGDFLHFHILDDGFIAFGKMWYRGQEIRIERNGKEWESTVDRVGETWLNYVEDVAAQYRIWGKQYFGLGPWPGVKWEDVPLPPDLTEVEKAEWKAGIARAAAAEKNRNGRVILEE